MSFWQDKNVLVVGGAGFVGVHLVTLLRDAGAEVVVMDDFSRGENKIDGVTYEYGDCSDEGTCRDFFKGAEYVFNLAAWVAGVIYNQSHHAEMFTKNLAAQAMPLKIAAEYGVERFLNVSSVCVYAPEHNHPCVEVNGHKGEVTAANEGYSLAKRMGEKLAQWYAKEQGLHVVNVRPSNAFGEQDYFDERAHVVPSMIMQCMNDTPYISVHGPQGSIRELICVRDLATGMMFALEHGEPSQSYNLGTNGRTKINTRDLLRMIQSKLGVEKEWIIVTKHDTGDDERWSDCTKIEQLGWKAETDLEKGLDLTVEWYKGR